MVAVGAHYRSAAVTREDLLLHVVKVLPKCCTAFRTATIPPSIKQHNRSLYFIVHSVMCHVGVPRCRTIRLGSKLQENALLDSFQVGLSSNPCFECLVRGCNTLRSTGYHLPEAYKHWEATIVMCGGLSLQTLTWRSSLSPASSWMPTLPLHHPTAANSRCALTCIQLAYTWPTHGLHNTHRPVFSRPMWVSVVFLEEHQYVL